MSSSYTLTYSTAILLLYRIKCVHTLHDNVVYIDVLFPFNTSCFESYETFSNHNSFIDMTHKALMILTFCLQWRVLSDILTVNVFGTLLSISILLCTKLLYLFKRSRKRRIDM